MRRIVYLTALTGALACAAPAAAQGATYTVWSCKKPNGTPAATEGWTVGGTPSSIAATTPCAGGNGAMRAGFNGAGAQETSTLTFTAPAGARIAGYVMYRSITMTSTAPAYRWTHLEDDTQVDACEGTCPRGDRNKPLGEVNVVSRGSLNLGSVTFRTLCTAPVTDPPQACPPTAPTEAMLAEVHRAAFLLTDDVLPEFVGPPTGTLLDGTRAQSGTVSASFQAKDTGSGVYEAIVEVDGVAVARQVVDANDGRCGEPFTSLKPCKASVSGSISLDTTTIANGRHNVSLIVTDGTGANRDAESFAITVDNSAGRGAANGTGASESAKLTAAFKGKTGAAITTGLGRKVVVEGRLTDTAGRPITNATLDVVGVERRLGAVEQPIGQTITGADGRYAITVTASVGRRLIVRYRAFVADTRAAAVAELALKVRAAPTLSISTRTVRPPRKVTFSGRLRGGSVPPGGKIGVIQVNLGGIWRAFRDLRTDRKGRFKVVYPFKVRQNRKLRFRVRVVKDGSYPFETGTSAVRVLRIRG